MSLKLRVAALLGLVLVVSTLLGAGVGLVEARRHVAEELSAALEGAERTAESAFEDLPRSDHRDRDLARLVSAFDGDRHLRVVLAGPGGEVRLASRPRTEGAGAPGVVRELVGGAARKAPVRLKAPGGAETLEFWPRPAADAEAAWRELSGVLIVAAVSAAAGLGLVYALIGLALSPLKELAARFEEIGVGDYAGRVTRRGPSELAPLQSGFNAMAARLASVSEQNRRLTQQIVSLQEEERAEIARDLHDDVGPHLFAAAMDAEMIVRSLPGAEDDPILARARGIQAAVSHVQREVRDLLLRLRQSPALELGLRAALEDLARFWRDRRPETAIDLETDAAADHLEPEVADAAYRLVGEALSNALRHGQPRRIAIRARAEGALALEVVDDGTGSTATGQAGSGVGLLGMRERVEGLGGKLVYGAAPGGGWRVEASLPLRPDPEALSRAPAPEPEGAVP